MRRSSARGSALPVAALFALVVALASCAGAKNQGAPEATRPPATYAPGVLLAARLSGFGLVLTDPQVDCVEAAIAGRPDLTLFDRPDAIAAREQTLAFFDVLSICGIELADFADTFVRSVPIPAPLTDEQDVCLRAAWSEASREVVADVVTATPTDASDAFVRAARERCGIADAPYPADDPVTTSATTGTSATGATVAR